MRYRKAPKPAINVLEEDRAVDCMRGGGTLVHMHSQSPTEKQWFVVPGDAVTDDVATKIRNRPDVSGHEDGLWPGHDQTWRMMK
jgi:hypothetical protein